MADRSRLAELTAQPRNDRRTIIEKFEAHASEVAFCVVLLTPDDEGYPRDACQKAAACTTERNF